MPDMIAAWHADHENFAKLLALLEDQLEPFCKGESPDYGLMLDIMYYMTHYPDIVHHPMEDRVFAQMKERAIGTRPKVDELMNQHAQLRESGEALVRNLDDIVNGSISSRERIETSARRYVATFREHMRIEETEVIPLAARSLRAEDWSAIEAAIAHLGDPLFGTTQERRYAALREQIATQVRAGK